MKKMYLFNGAIIIFTFFCLSCGAASDPPIDGAEKLFIKEYIVVEDGSKPYKVLNFNKLNSKSTVHPLDGKDANLVSYNCTIEITNNCYIKIVAGKDYTNMLPSIEKVYLSVNKPHPIGLWNYKTVDKGKQVSINNILAFRKTDKGWSSLPVYLKF